MQLRFRSNATTADLISDIATRRWPSTADLKSYVENKLSELEFSLSRCFWDDYNRIDYIKNEIAAAKKVLRRIK